MFDLTQPKHQLALGLLGVLLALKFAVMPLIEWQNEQLSTIANLQKRVGKSQSVIANQAQINQAQQQIGAQLDAVNSLFFKHQAQSEFKLTKQQRIEQTVAHNQLQITSSNWLPSILVANGQLMRHSLRLSIKGSMLDYTNLITELESTTPKGELRTFNINVKGQRSKKLGRVEGSIELAFYMQVQPAPATAQEAQ